MEELVKWLLTSGGQISMVGLLLAFIAVAGVGLHKDWWVTGSRWRDKVQDCTDERTAKDVCLAALKAEGDRYHETRIELVAARLDRERQWSASSLSQEKRT